eukprot:gene2841-3466_t
MSLEPGTNRSKGFCFITYDNPASAEAALALNGMEVAGRKIKVGRPFSPQNAGGANNAAAVSFNAITSSGANAREQAQLLLQQAMNSAFLAPTPVPGIPTPVPAAAPVVTAPAVVSPPKPAAASPTVPTPPPAQPPVQLYDPLEALTAPS